MDNVVDRARLATGNMAQHRGIARDEGALRIGDGTAADRIDQHGGAKPHGQGPHDQHAGSGPHGGVGEATGRHCRQRAHHEDDPSRSALRHRLANGIEPDRQGHPDIACRQRLNEHEQIRQRINRGSVNPGHGAAIRGQGRGNGAQRGAFGPACEGAPVCEIDSHAVLPLPRLATTLEAGQHNIMLL